MKNIRFVLPICIVFVLLVILFQTVLILGYVPSSSMEPTLKENSMVIGFRLHGVLKKNDIIIFKHDNKTLVKRIAAVGGETVSINGMNQTVPDRCYYVLGDNSEQSYDSRYWADPFVKNNDVVARLIIPFK